MADTIRTVAETTVFFLALLVIKLPVLLGYALLALVLDATHAGETLEMLVLILSVPVFVGVYLAVLIPVC